MCLKHFFISYRSLVTPLDNMALRDSQKINNHHDLLIGRLADHTSLMMAANEGLIEDVSTLLVEGCGINATTSNGLTALFYAVARNNHTIAEKLLEAGADPNYRYKIKVGHPNRVLKGNSILMAAACKGDESLVELLLMYGADIDAYAQRGMTALAFSVVMRNFSCTDALIAAGAEVRSTDEFDRTLLMTLVHNFGIALHWGLSTCGKYSAFRGPSVVSMTKKLLAYGCPINELDGNGQNLLADHVHQHMEKRTAHSVSEDMVCMLILAAGEDVCHESATQAMKYLPRWNSGNDDDSGIDERPTCPGCKSGNIERVPPLKDLCRAIVRDQCIAADRHRNLFLSIPDLELPTMIADYLLFGMSLDEDDDDDARLSSSSSLSSLSSVTSDDDPQEAEEPKDEPNLDDGPLLQLHSNSLQCIMHLLHVSHVVRRTQWFNPHSPQPLTTRNTCGT